MGSSMVPATCDHVLWRWHSAKTPVYHSCGEAIAVADSGKMTCPRCKCWWSSETIRKMPEKDLQARFFLAIRTEDSEKLLVWVTEGRERYTRLLSHEETFALCGTAADPLVAKRLCDF